MSGNDNPPGLWPVYGDGVLAREGDLVLLIHPAGGTFSDRLLDLLADAARAGEDGGRFAYRASSAFDGDAASAPEGSPSPEPGPGAVAFGPDGGGTAIAVYGTAWVELTTAHGVQLLSAGQPYGRLRCVLPSRAIKIRAGIRAVGDGVSTDRSMCLADGIVRAVGLVYVPGSAAGADDAGAGAQAVSESAAGTEAASASEEAVSDVGGRLEEGGPRRDFISVSLAGDRAYGEVPRRDALPLGPESPDAQDASIAERPPPVVIGVRCKNGDFNDPEARYCAVCGIGMAQLTKAPQTGPRPPLGVLVLDDGSVFRLDADYVIGREPSLDSSVADGSARPLRLADASGLVSRVHARVELDGWQVFVCDLNSANGTYIRVPGGENSERLTPGVRTLLVVGSQVRLGSDYGLRYDSHRHR